MPSAVRAQPFARPKLLRDASWKAVHDAMKADPMVHVFGEGCEVKSHYDSPAIERDYPDRLHTMPIAEDSSVNFAVGASLLGIKPIVDIISADFLYRAMDSICNTAAKLPNPATIVIRAEFLLGGPTTGQRPEAMFCHVPGLRVVVPSTPRDAYGLMASALAEPGVTLYFEDRMIEDAGPWTEQDLQSGGVIPQGAAICRQRGMAGVCSILTYGVMRQRVERILATQRWVAGACEEPNIRCDLWDLRSLYPLDWSMVRFAARRGPILIVEPDVTYGGIGAEIAAHVVENKLRAEVKRLGAPRMTIPAAASLHHRVLPSDQEVIDAITKDW